MFTAGLNLRSAAALVPNARLGTPGNVAVVGQLAGPEISSGVDNVAVHLVRPVRAVVDPVAHLVRPNKVGGAAEVALDVVVLTV